MRRHPSALTGARRRTIGRRRDSGAHTASPAGPASRNRSDRCVPCVGSVLIHNRPGFICRRGSSRRLWHWFSARRSMKSSRRQSHPTTIYEVAQRAGVAASSVSRVLSGHPNISRDMRRRVLSAANELGYKTDLVAASLRSGSTRTVGFVLRDISNPVFADIVKGAENVFRGAGYSMLLTNSEGRAELDAAHIHLLQQRRVDGLIFSLASDKHRDTISAL